MFWKKNKTPKYQAPQITDATFNESVLKSKIPVLLDFYADWCDPCKVMSPIINELSEEFEGRALVAKINTESNPKLSQHFKVKSIPTLILINRGELFERYKGVVPKPNLAEILELYILENEQA
ncbi:MAG: thioredoxin [Flavobacteriales bacterium]